MQNNETILAFLKANLGKDFNNDYNDLGCAQTVNNILKLTLGYVAGGGPSTAAMLTSIIKDPNFKEMTKFTARAGDIVLSATGTGNGVVSHGHVGFLGENGVIYSNNSYKDMLDDHITAEQWKQYFSLKGGFPTRYFRAIGESTNEKEVDPTPVEPAKEPTQIVVSPDTILSSRVKSLLWRTGMMAIAFAATSLAASVSTLDIPNETKVMIGLLLGEVSKYINNKYGNK